MAISDFNDAERWVVDNALKERYGQRVHVEPAEAEVQLKPEDAEPTLCPSLYWTERGAHFVIFKTGEDHYRAQFFYSDNEQFGIGREEWDDLAECVVTLLRLQADHEKERAGVTSGKTGSELEGEFPTRYVDF